MKNTIQKKKEAYRKQRNLVPKLKKRKVRTYFLERCIRGDKTNNFWPTVKQTIFVKKKNRQVVSKKLF